MVSAADRREWDARPDVIALREQGRCGCRKSKSNPPAPCRSYAAGCRFHGKHRGAGRPWVHGGRSKASQLLRDELRNRAKDPVRLLHGEALEKLALVDHALDKRLDRLTDDKDSPAFRGHAVELFQRVKAAMDGGDAADLVSSIDALGKHLRRGAREDEALSSAVTLAGKRLRHTADMRRVIAQEAVTNSAVASRMAIVFSVAFHAVLEATGDSEIVERVRTMLDGYQTGAWVPKGIAGGANGKASAKTIDVEVTK